MPTGLDDHIDLPVSLRPMTAADMPALFQLCAEIEAQDHTAEFNAVDFARWWHDPARSSQIHLAYLVQSEGNAGRLLGYVDASPPEDDHVAWGFLLVHPAYRRRGVGRALYARFEQDVLPHQPTTLMFHPKQHSTALQEFLRHRGYAIERYFWDLRLPAEHLVPAPQWPGGVTVRTFVGGQDEELFLRIYNATFADHYLSSQNTLEGIIRRTTEAYFQAEGVSFAFVGKDIVGYCYAGIEPEALTETDVRLGYIYELGVLPAYRHQGFGRALLLSSIRYLRQQVSVVGLRVEGKNSVAVGLYESVGFHPVDARVNMTKRVPGEPDAVPAPHGERSGRHGA